MESRASLNFYPGLFGGPFSGMGASALLERTGEVRAGLTMQSVPGLGLGYEFGRTP